MTTKTFTGTLVVLSVKRGRGKRGPWAAYNGKVEKANGEEYDDWVSFGFEKPECEQGDEVVIVTRKEDGYWRVQEVTVTKKGEQDSDEEDSESGDNGTEETQSDDESDQQASSPSKSKVKTKVGGSVQQNIHYQNSRTAAIELADLLLKHKAVPLSATTGKAGEAKRFEEVTALVNKLTVIFYHDLESFRLVKDIEDVYEKAPTAEAGFDPEEEQSDDSDD